MDNTGIPVNMPVMPANYGGGFGDFGGNGWWIILLFLFAGGFGGFGGYGMGNGAGFVGADVQRGFDQSALMTGLSGVQNSITSGFGDVQTALCGGFANINANISNGFAQAEIGENARQMANMNQMFGIQSGIENLKFTVAQEACADRASVTNALADLTSLINARFNQAEMQRFQDKVDAKNEKILELQNSLNMANLSASQTAQTATILAALTTTTPAVA
jgi:hypothetical protein